MGTDKKMILGKIGFIFGVLAQIGMCYTIFATFSFLMIALFYVVIFAIILLTLFTILFNHNFMEFLGNSQSITDFSNTLVQTIPYSASVSIGLAMISLFIMIFGKEYPKRKSGIITSSIVIVISAGLLLLHLFSDFNIV